MMRMTLALAAIAATLAMASAAPSVVAIEHAFHLYPGAVFPIICRPASICRSNTCSPKCAAPANTPSS